MGIFTRTRRPNSRLSLVASSKKLGEDDARFERSGEAYGLQLRSLAYNESIGEIWYGAKFYERSMRNVKLIVQKREGNDWKLTEEQGPNEKLRTLTDRNGETSGLLGMYGRLMFLTGDARLFGTRETDGGAVAWEMLSVQEMRVNAEGKYVRKSGPTQPDEIIDAAARDVFEPTPGAAVMFRLWTPSPRFSAEADWPLRANLDLCEELLLLTRKVRGEIRSRLAGNGILGIPQELMLATTENGPRGDEDPLANGFLKALTEAMETAIQQDNAASALVPIILTGPADYVDKMTHLSFSKPQSDDEARRNEVIKRLALSLDMPPEALLGIADTNHWGAWQIDESSWKVHIQPVCQTLVENLTSSWFRPVLQSADYRIWYDESEVVNHPDRSTDFKDANDRYIVSNEAYRTAIGASDDDAMQPDEQDRMAQLKALAHRGSNATETPPAGSDAAAGAAQAGPGGAPAGGPPTPPQAEPSRAATPIPTPQAAKVLAAAEIAAWRGRELAGSRLRSKVDRQTFKATPNMQLAFASRENTLLDADPGALVAGCGSMLAHMLDVWGVPREMSDTIVAGVAEHTRDTLFEASPLPLPDELVAMCVLASMGSDGQAE